MDDGMAALFHGEWLKNKCGVEKNTEMYPHERRTEQKLPRKNAKRKAEWKILDPLKHSARSLGVSGVIIIVSK